MTPGARARSASVILRQRIRRVLGRAPVLETIYRRTLAPGYPDHLRAVVQRPIVARFVGTAPGDVLEIAPGEGMHTAVLAPRASRYYACGLGSASPVPHLPVTYVAGDAQCLPFRSESFDLVICTEVLEHLPDDVGAAREISRVLRPGGRAVVSTPVPPAPAPDSEHVREGYTLCDLRRLMGATDLVIVQHAYCILAIGRAVIRVYRWSQGFGLRFPAGLLIGLAHLDRHLSPWLPRRPYDVVIHAEKRR